MTGGQILDALETVGSDPGNVPAAAYFSIFLKPSGVTSYTYSWEGAPSTASQNTAWEASTITDFSLGAGTYARFSKAESQVNVAILSRANGLGTNIFLGFTYHDDGTWPIGWGSIDGQIMEILAESATFRFQIDTAETLSGSYFLTGQVTELVSSSSLNVQQPKTEPNVTFYLETTPILVVPEPATYAIFGSGVLFLLIADRVRRRRKVASR